MTVAAHSTSQRRSLSPPTNYYTPEHESADLATSGDPFQPPRRPQTRPCSRPNRPAFGVPSHNTARYRPSRRPPRLLRHPQIPIDRGQPNSALPPRGFLLGRLSDAGPASRTTVPNGPASETFTFANLSRFRNQDIWNSAFRPKVGDF